MYSSTSESSHNKTMYSNTSEHIKQITFDNSKNSKLSSDSDATKSDGSHQNDSYFPFDKYSTSFKSGDLDGHNELPTISSRSNTPHLTMRKVFPVGNIVGSMNNYSPAMYNYDNPSYERQQNTKQQIKLSDAGMQTALTYVSTPHKTYLHDDEYASDYNSPAHTVLYKPKEPGFQIKTSNMAVQTALSHTSSQGKTLLNIQSKTPPATRSTSKQVHRRCRSGESNWSSEFPKYNMPMHEDVSTLVKGHSIKISETSFSSSVPTLGEPSSINIFTNAYKQPQNRSSSEYPENDQCIKIYETTSQAAYGFQQPDQIMKTSNLVAQIALPTTSQSFESLSTDDHAEILIKLPIRRSFV